MGSLPVKDRVCAVSYRQGWWFQVLLIPFLPVVEDCGNIPAGVMQTMAVITVIVDGRIVIKGLKGDLRQWGVGNRGLGSTSRVADSNKAEQNNAEQNKFFRHGIVTICQNIHNSLLLPVKTDKVKANIVFQARNITAFIVKALVAELVGQASRPDAVGIGQT